MFELLMILVSLLLVVACGVFVAAEFAFVTVDRSKIDKLAATNDKQAKGVQTALRSLSTQLSGAQIGITLTNLGIGFLAQPAIASLLYGPLELVGVTGAAATSISIILALLLATFLTMLFGELLPKNLAIARPVQTARLVQGPQRLFSHVMRVPIDVTNGTSNTIVRKLGIEPQEELASARSTEELLSVVKHSAEKGTLAKDTAILLERSLEFSDRHASDIMTPRVKLNTIEVNNSLQSVIEHAKSSGFSRFPVISESIDNIVGFIHIKDAVSIKFQERSNQKVGDHMQPVLFVPSSMELDGLIEKMRLEKTEAIITVDEFGGVDGLVTFEDLIEELVGEVKDEHDEKGKAIIKTKPNIWSISGLLRADEVSQELDIVLPEDEEFETIGGLVFDRLEKIPEVGDTTFVKGLDRNGADIRIIIRVTKMDARRVDRVELSVDDPKPDGAIDE